MRNCAEPPSKHDVAEILYSLMLNCNYDDMTAKQRAAFIDTATRIRKTPPNIDFMLKIISTINPNHRLFAKDYKRPRVDARGNELPDSERQVNDPFGFLSGLPLAKKSKKRSTIKFMDAQTKQAIKLQKMEQQKRDLEVRIARQASRVPERLQERRQSNSSAMQPAMQPLTSTFNQAFSFLRVGD